MDHLHVRGAVHSNGSFTPGWWRSVPGDGATASQGELDARGVWSAATLDADNNILTRSAARLTESHVCPAGINLGFSAIVAVPQDAACVVILDGPREMYRRPVPVQPTVRLSAQFEAQMRRRSIDVPVSIDGPGCGSGAYLVASLQSPDRPSLPLGLLDLGSGAPAVVRLDPSGLSGRAPYRLAVSYFDGVRSVEANSDLFSFEQLPASPVLVKPADRTAVADDGFLELVGRVDGDGEPGELVWLLDGEIVGRGASATVKVAQLTYGAHEVILQIGTKRTSVSVTVTKTTPDAAPSPQWEPPWRSAVLQTLSWPSYVRAVDPSGLTKQRDAP